MKLIAIIACAVTLLGVTPKVVLVQPDDMMDSPRPKASLTAWHDAAGRKHVSLAVPGALLRGYSYDGHVGSAPVLVVFGGSGNLISRHDSAMRGFARFVSRVIWYDYRGYGFSTGIAHFQTLREDALRVVDAAAQPAGGTNNVVVLGYSMGTDIAEYVAMHRSIRGLILAAPWNDYVAMYAYQDSKTIYRFSQAARAAFDETAMVKKIGVPLLVFQGTKDDAIPPAQGSALERAAASREKTFVPIPGAKHDWLLENAYSQSAVHHFIERVSNHVPAQGS